MPLNIEQNAPDEEKVNNSILGKALDFAKGFSNDDVIEDKKQRKSKKSPEEFNTLVIAFVTLATSLTIPENLRPVENEISIFSNHLAGILSRHLNISGKLSADALDIIGLITCASLYYARISPELKVRKEKAIKPEVKPQPQEPEVNDGKPIISQLIPQGTQEFLRKAEQDAINNANNKNQ